MVIKSNLRHKRWEEAFEAFMSETAKTPQSPLERYQTFHLDNGSKMTNEP